MHIAGSIEPELMLDLPARNGMTLRWDTPEALRDAYRFENLQSFLDVYFEGCKVLVTERDFFDVTAVVGVGREHVLPLDPKAAAVSPSAPPNRSSLAPTS